MSVMDKLKKNSKIKTTEVLDKSVFFTEKEMVPTEVPMINVALSGDPDGGLTSGLTVLAGPSKHFKTSFALLTKWKCLVNSVSMSPLYQNIISKELEYLTM